MTKIFSALGTVNRITLPLSGGADKERVSVLLDDIEDMVESMDDRMSVFKPDSEISAVNAASGESTVPVSSDTFEIVKAACHYSEITGGAFDITTRPLSQLWGIGKKGAFIPGRREIKSARSLVGYKGIITKITDDSQYEIGLSKKGQQIDLGSIAKGAAADRAAGMLREEGLTDAIIDFGGTVVVLDVEHKVGVRDPAGRSAGPVWTLKTAGKAVVTSGSYEKSFMKNGVLYHHIIDPRTGMPARNDIAGVTLTGGSALELDALSTAVFIEGIEKGYELMRANGTEGLFILRNGNMFATKGVKNGEII